MIKKGLLPMRLQFFAEPGDMGNLDSILAGMDGASDEPEDNNDTDEPGDTDETDEPGEEDNADQQTQQQKPANNKQDYAWAQMRAQNNQFKTLLGKIANATGIEFSNDNELLDKLSEDAITKLAQKDNVPVELLKRMEMLEQHSQAYQAQQLQSAALVGFQQIKNNYNLTDEELQSFAQQLDEAGKNPFLQKVDLDAEYKVLNFNDIVQKQVQAAVEAALKKSSAADTHSSKPNQTGGRKDTGDLEKITTVQGLGALLNKMQ